MVAHVLGAQGTHLVNALRCGQLVHFSPVGAGVFCAGWWFQRGSERRPCAFLRCGDFQLGFQVGQMLGHHSFHLGGVHAAMHAALVAATAFVRAGAGGTGHRLGRSGWWCVVCAWATSAALASKPAIKRDFNPGFMRHPLGIADAGIAISMERSLRRPCICTMRLQQGFVKLRINVRHASVHNTWFGNCCPFRKGCLCLRI